MSFPREQVELLRQLAQSLGSSLFVTVLAAFKLLLRRYSGRDDLVVSTPSSGRNRPELQGGLVGCFVNLIALRTNMAGTWSCLCCHEARASIRTHNRSLQFEKQPGSAALQAPSCKSWTWMSQGVVAKNEVGSFAMYQPDLCQQDTSVMGRC